VDELDDDEEPIDDVWETCPSCGWAVRPWEFDACGGLCPACDNADPMVAS